MSVKRLMLCCAVVLAACSDNPVAPDAKHQQFDFPSAVQSPSINFSVGGPRIEIYSNGVLQQSISGNGGSTAQPALPASLPADFDKALDNLERKPLNKRTGHFVQVMRQIASAPEAARNKVIDAVAKQLLRDTEHRDTTLEDGTRVLEYYFDHQLATRVFLPRQVVAGKRPFNGLHSAVNAPVAATTLIDPDETTCYSDCGGNDPALDAMYFAVLTWQIDQYEAMLGTAAIEGDDGSGSYPVYMMKCLGETLSWTYSVATLGASLAVIQENWAKLTSAGKAGAISATQSVLNGLINSWTTLHSCFHP